MRTTETPPAEMPDHDLDRWHDDGGAVPPERDPPAASDLPQDGLVYPEGSQPIP